MDKIPKFTEFETKYKTDLSALPIFNRIVSSLPNLESFLYTCGPDVYHSHSNNCIGRYRSTLDGKFAQWTVKRKPDGAKNNVYRFESNWNVAGTPADEVDAGAKQMGFVFDFKIHKNCFIYKFQDATVVMYWVREDGTEKEDYYIEIEVTEETIHELTEDQAWGVINKYEKLLEPVGISPQKRMKKSLFELYTKQELK